ncbi:MAG: trypsin-like peptidase domain-containing protein [Pyrinomonadaceae bacterium]|nr:trypsin-like peptidase domain-containing protein [Pyrinomonadaceae bacterium]
MRRLFFMAVAMLFLLAALLPTQRSFVVSAVSDGERLAMFSKPSVVRIIDGVAGTFLFAPPKQQPKNYTVSYIGLGSGFFINAAGYIVTNAHVVNTSHDIKQKGEEAGHELLFYQLLQQIARDYNVSPNALTRENVVFIRNYSRLTEMKQYHHVIIPDGSVYEFEEKQFGAPVGQGKDVAVIKIEVKNAPVLILGSSDVKLQDHVTVLGYPGAADTFNSGILDSKSSLEASITDGKISAQKRSASGAPVLQVSAPATHGNSGGPVMTDKHEVAGLLTFGGDRVNDQEVSGFAFVVPSSTVLEFVKAAGATNELGTADKAYREGLELYWAENYSQAIPKFEEVKRLFPEHSEVSRLAQDSQQKISEGKDKSSTVPTSWIIGGVLVFIVIVIAVIVIAVVGFLLMRRRGKSKSTAGADVSATPLGGSARGSAPKPEPQRPTPSPSFSAPQAPRSPSPPPFTPNLPAGGGVDRSATIDLSRTVAIIPDGDTAPINWGTIKFVSGLLAGQKFDITPDGSCIGRDSTVSEIVITDPRISKRHVWIGVKEGRVVITDQNSRNGTFVNDPKSQRVTETPLSLGDTVILGESDVARFEYQK